MGLRLAQLDLRHLSDKDGRMAMDMNSKPDHR